MPVLRVAFQGKSLEEFAQLYHSHVSSLGMFIRTSDVLPVGTRLTFEFTLEDGRPLLNGRAVVVWITEDTGNPELPPGIELRFEWMPSDSRRCFDWLLLYKRGAALGLPELPVPAPRPPAAAPLDPQRLPSVRRPGTATGSTAGSTGPNTRELLVDDSALTGKPRGEAEPEQRAGQAAPTQKGDTDPGQLFHAVAISWDDTDRWARRSSSPRSSSVDVNQVPGKRRWLILGVAGTILLGLGITMAYRALSDSANSPSSGGLRLLRLATEPSGAEVLVDGLPAGKTPLELPVKLSSRVLLRFGETGETREVPLVGQHWVREGEVDVLELRIPLLVTPAPSRPKPKATGALRQSPPARPAASPRGHAKPAGPPPQPSSARPPAEAPSRPPAAQPGPAPAADQPSLGNTQPAAPKAAKPPADPPGQKGTKIPDWVNESSH